MNGSDVPPAIATPHFLLDWCAGAGAAIDLSMTPDQSGQYLLRYASPFRPTMRSPASTIAPSDDDFRQLVGTLRTVPALRALGVRGGGSAGKDRADRPSRDQAAADDALVRLANFGQALTAYVVPGSALRDLGQPDLFIEIGTDEGLLRYPWELMHDGQDFLCLRHFVGRYVNLSRPFQSTGAPGPGPAADLGELRVLIVGVPRPQSQDGPPFAELTAADAEVRAVKAAMEAIGIVPTVIVDQNATVEAVRRELLTKRYHIVHFTGHAMYDSTSKRSSAIVLQDGLLSAGVLTNMFARQQGAVLCFVNACETVRADAGAPAGAAGQTLDWNAQYDIFGLARPFLESGAYLLGSRWLLPDEPAALFAQSFYRLLLADGMPIGQAITRARQECRVQYPGDLSWASYVYYGDPRVAFRRSDVPATAQGPRPPVEVTAAERPVRIDRERLRRLALEYESVRKRLKPGWERTGKMTNLMSEASSSAARSDAAEVLPELIRGSPGERVVALALLEADPNAAYFEDVLGFIDDPRSPFEQYHALVVAERLVPNLGADQLTALGGLLQRKLQDEAFFGTDRAVLSQAILGTIRPLLQGAPDAPGSQAELAIT